MPSQVYFRPFASSDREACLKIFDENCPSHFAINEREDYEAFLEDAPKGYEVCTLDGDIVGAYGLSGENQQFYDLNWILISPNNQRIGIGHQFMSRAIHRAKNLNVAKIKIATSHLATAFFAKYGAIEISYIPDGWGLGMHRVDMELNL